MYIHAKFEKKTSKYLVISRDRASAQHQKKDSKKRGREKVQKEKYINGSITAVDTVKRKKKKKKTLSKRKGQTSDCYKTLISFIPYLVLCFLFCFDSFSLVQGTTTDEIVCYFLASSTVLHFTAC